MSKKSIIAYRFPLPAMVQKSIETNDSSFGDIARQLEYVVAELMQKHGIPDDLYTMIDVEVEDAHKEWSGHIYLFFEVDPKVEDYMLKSDHRTLSMDFLDQEAKTRGTIRRKVKVAPRLSWTPPKPLEQGTIVQSGVNLLPQGFRND